MKQPLSPDVAPNKVVNVLPSSTPTLGANIYSAPTVLLDAAKLKEKLASLEVDLLLKDNFLLTEEFDETSPEFSESKFMENIATLDEVLRLQRKDISDLEWAVDSEGKGLKNRKQLLEKSRKGRDALIKLRARIMQRIDDEDNVRFLKESLEPYF